MFNTLKRGLCLLTGSTLERVRQVDPEMPRDDAGGIIAAGPITKQPGTAVFRTVLRVISTLRETPEFVVHHQIWDDQHTLPDGSLSIHPDGPCRFEEGQYFYAEQLPDAMAAFAKRIASDAENVKSIYRSYYEREQRGLPQR